MKRYQTTFAAKITFNYKDQIVTSSGSGCTAMTMNQRIFGKTDALITVINILGGQCKKH